MPLPSAHAFGSSPDYGVIDTALDDGKTHADSQLPIAGDMVNQHSADIKAVHDAESVRRGYATVLTSTTALDSTAHDKVYTNTGASGAASTRPVTLPSDAAVKRVSFYDDNTLGFRIVANTGQTIRVGLGPANVTKSGGYLESNGEGAFITLQRISANKWVAVAPTLDWTPEIS